MKKKFILIIGIALLTSYSCQKSQLYPALPTQISNQGGVAFSTSARIYSQVLGLYAQLRSGQLYGGRFQIYNDVKADNWINNTVNSVTAYQTWTETVTSSSSEVINLWQQCYYTINYCNLFIDGMGTYGNAVLGNAALSANYIGEAKFVRALAYYALLDMYCVPFSSGTSAGVPLRLKGNSAYGDYSIAPSTIATCYAQVITDLNDAEAGLPLTYADATSNVIRATRNAAIAFKTRVYLAEGNYNSVITEANKIVTATAPFTASTGVPYALQASIANVFKSPYTTTESILSMPFTTTEPVGGQNALADYFNSTGTTEFILNTSSTLLNDPLWTATDARKAFVITSTKGTKNITKWALGSPYLDWANVMRYSEVLLNLAEARSNTAGASDPQAVALLNAVRKRSDPTTTFTTATVAQILEERNIEFLGEGLRWADELRLGLAIPAKGVVPGVAVGGYSTAYIWPMSNFEEQYNPLIGR
jgi:hypothetical protein